MPCSRSEPRCRWRAGWARSNLGIFVYVWTWVLMIGALSDLGLSSAARRFIPEYTKLDALEDLRGFLAARAATGNGETLGAFGVWLLAPVLDNFVIIPLYLGCVIILYGGETPARLPRLGGAIQPTSAP